MHRYILLFLLFGSSLLAQEGGSSGGGGGGLLSLLFPLILMFAIFYFLLILPQSRREKKRKQMLSQVRKGDRVVTTGGIIGSVHRVDEDSITLRVSGDVTLKLEKGAVRQVLSETPKPTP
jgi:preprotein translocase subunit YajC